MKNGVSISLKKSLGGHPPYVFAKHGIFMLAYVLSSEMVL